MTFFTWKHRAIVLSLSLAVIGFFVLIGYLIGKATDNLALFIMLGVIISYPFSLFTLTKVLKKDADKPENNKPKDDTGQK